MRICIVGPGAIGLFFAKKLAGKNELVLVCRRKEHADCLNKEFEATTKIRKAGNPDLFVLSTKAYDCFNALKQIRQHSDANVLAIQNGLIKFHDEQVIRGITTYAATRMSDSESLLKAEGELVIEKKPVSENIVMSFQESGINTSISENIERLLWEKFFINVGINALGAITGKKNGELIENKVLKDRMKKIVEEAVIVSKKDFDKDTVFQKTVSIAAQTKDNKSSMLQDLEAGRKTELKFLNEAVCTLGRIEGIETPENSRVVKQIKHLEKMSKH